MPVDARLAYDIVDKLPAEPPQPFGGMPRRTNSGSTRIHLRNTSAQVNTFHLALRVIGLPTWSPDWAYFVVQPHQNAGSGPSWQEVAFNPDDPTAEIEIRFAVPVDLLARAGEYEFAIDIFDFNAGGRGRAGTRPPDDTLTGKVNIHPFYLWNRKLDMKKAARPSFFQRGQREARGELLLENRSNDWVYLQIAAEGGSDNISLDLPIQRVALPPAASTSGTKRRVPVRVQFEQRPLRGDKRPDQVMLQVTQLSAPSVAPVPRDNMDMQNPQADLTCGVVVERPIEGVYIQDPTGLTGTATFQPCLPANLLGAFTLLCGLLLCSVAAILAFALLFRTLTTVKLEAMAGDTDSAFKIAVKGDPAPPFYGRVSDYTFTVKVIKDNVPVDPAQEVSNVESGNTTAAKKALQAASVGAGIPSAAGIKNMVTDPMKFATLNLSAFQHNKVVIYAKPGGLNKIIGWLPGGEVRVTGEVQVGEPTKVAPTTDDVVDFGPPGEITPGSPFKIALIIQDKEKAKSLTFDKVLIGEESVVPTREGDNLIVTAPTTVSGSPLLKVVVNGRPKTIGNVAVKLTAPVDPSLGGTVPPEGTPPNGGQPPQEGTTPPANSGGTENPGASTSGSPSAPTLPLRQKMITELASAEDDGYANPLDDANQQLKTKPDDLRALCVRAIALLKLGEGSAANARQQASVKWRASEASGGGDRPAIDMALYHLMEGMFLQSEGDDAGKEREFTKSKEHEGSFFSHLMQ